MRSEHHDPDKDGTVDDQLHTCVRAPQICTRQLADRRQDERAEKRSQEGSRSSDDGYKKDLNGEGGAEKRRFYVKKKLCVKRTRRCPEKGADGEGDHFIPRCADPDGARSLLIVPDRGEVKAPSRLLDPVIDEEYEQQHGQDDVIVVSLVRELEVQKRTSRAKRNKGSGCALQIDPPDLLGKVTTMRKISVKASVASAKYGTRSLKQG